MATFGSRLTWLLELGILLGIFALAMMVRLWHWPEVISDGQLWIFADDPPYHLRRALMTLATWPRVPTFDPFLNFPHGGTIYWPPGLAWLLAALVKLLSPSAQDVRHTLEWVATLMPPLVGGLTAAGVYLVGRRVWGRVIGLGAAGLLVILPAHVQYSVLGRYDHHFFEPLLGGLILWSIVRAASAQRRARYLGWIVAGSISVGLALLVWPGILLQLGLIVLAILVVIVYQVWAGGAFTRGGPSGSDRARRIARSAGLVFAGSLFTTLPAIFCSPWGTKVVFFAPSLLHLTSLAVASFLFLLGGYAPARLRALPRGLGYLLPAILLLALLGMSRSLRQGIGKGLHYLTSSDFAAQAVESQGILNAPGAFFSITSWSAALATLVCVVLLVWSIVSSRRNGSQRNAPLIGVVLSVEESMIFVATGTFLLPALLATRWLAAWSPWGCLATMGLWPALFCPLGSRIMPGAPARWAFWCALALLGLVLPSLLYSLSLEVISPEQRAAQSLIKRTRALTPEAARHEYSEKARPSYGVLTDWSVGHLVTYLAGRPTLANNFFGVPSYDRANHQAMKLLFEKSCDRAAHEMRRLRLRYLLTTPLELRRSGADGPQPFFDEQGRPTAAAARLLITRLGIQDGQSVMLPQADGSPEILAGCGHFRLIDEAHFPGSPRAQPGDVKLYEQVPGARLQIPCPARARIEVSLPLLTPSGRKLRWFSRALCPAAGLLELRVPYPTDPFCVLARQACPVHAAARYYSVRMEEQRLPLTVSTGAVYGGEVITLPGR